MNNEKPRGQRNTRKATTYDSKNQKIKKKSKTKEKNRNKTITKSQKINIQILHIVQIS